MKWVLLSLVFLHGAFASGMIPVMNVGLGTEAPVAFALYFAGMVVGQLGIWRVGALAKPGHGLAAYELLFAGALFYMAALFSPIGFLSGRFLEGIGSGMTLPLVFGHVVRLTDWGAAEKRVASMNSAFALGFVAGPAMVRGIDPLLGTRGSLVAFGALFVACALWLGALRPRGFDEPDEAATSRDETTRGLAGVALFFPIFAAKTTYGFMLAFVSGNAHTFWPELGVVWLLLILSVLFVVGQVIGTRLLRAVPKRALSIALPVLLATSMTWFALGDGELAIFAVALVHSLLALVGYHGMSGIPESARRFALFNLLSDPGMILGAALALPGAVGGFGLVVLGALGTALFVLRRRPAIG
jgi:predicted MFS family arabinose efflux permease